MSPLVKLGTYLISPLFPKQFNEIDFFPFLFFRWRSILRKKSFVESLRFCQFFRQKQGKSGQKLPPTPLPAIGIGILRLNLKFFFANLALDSFKVLRKVNIIRKGYILRKGYIHYCCYFLMCKIPILGTALLEDCSSSPRVPSNH